MMLRACLAVLVVGSVVAASTAAPYSIFYSGDDFPENEGWSRAVFDEPGGPGAVRSLNDGTFTIDSTRSDQIADIYRVSRSINPAPGEVFIAEWRMRVVQQSGFRNGVLAIARDNIGTLSFSVESGVLYNNNENWSVSLTPGEFHIFRIVSADMSIYTLSIDGMLVRTGLWDSRGLNRSFIGWGDNSTGANSLVVLDWDYLSFSVVPEPRMGFLLLVPFVAATRRNR
ncbi:MAG: hypothetical protein IPM64_09615 [Phycisphaerales bacterium]|nr:hypothetical protein [Phycisphaerales bacterium]